MMAQHGKIAGNNFTYKHIRMEENCQQIIRDILNGLGLRFQEPDDHNRPRFQIIACEENVIRNIFFNIPKNKKFVFQLIFENGNNDRGLRDSLANELRFLFGDPYPIGGGYGMGGYLTIYLPDNVHIIINNFNIANITLLIKNEIAKVCKAYNSLLQQGLL